MKFVKVNKLENEDIASELLAKAVELIGDEDGALRWLATPNFALNGRTPQEVAQTPEGLQEVLTFIDRAKYDVF
jgi:uncharacterized protein (DUF2384 family)